jgi:ABC-2 type transport system ATP-binding protein
MAQETVSDVIRQAKVRPSAALRVPGDAVVRAEQAMAGVSGLTVDRGDHGSGWLNVRSGGTPDPELAVVDRLLNLGLRAVLDAGIPIIAFEVDGARLSAAFLALTGAVER